MSKKTQLLTILILVLSCVSLSQQTKRPLMLYFHPLAFTIEQTDFCKKYKCMLDVAHVPKGVAYAVKQGFLGVTRYDPDDPKILGGSKDAKYMITEWYDLVGYGEKITGFPEHDGYSIKTFRIPVKEGSKNYRFTRIQVELPRHFMRNELELRASVYNVINDLNRLCAGVMFTERQMRYEIIKPTIQQLRTRIPENTDLGKFYLQAGGADGSAASSGVISYQIEYVGETRDSWTIASQ